MIRHLILAGSLAAGGVGLTACHTTNPQTTCAELVASIFYDDYRVVDADTISGGRARCLLQHKTTFTTTVACVRYADHQIVSCA